MNSFYLSAPFFILLMLSSSVLTMPAYASYEDMRGCNNDDDPVNIYKKGEYESLPVSDVVKHHPVVKLYLEKNPHLSMEDATGYSNSAGALPHFWTLGGLHLNLDNCYDVAFYHYTDPEGKKTIGIYQNHLNVIEAITGEKIPCENPKTGYPDSYYGREHLEEDLLFRGFIKANPDSDLYLSYPYPEQYASSHGVSNSLMTGSNMSNSGPVPNLWASYVWRTESSFFYIHDYPNFRIELDKCFNVAYFGYSDIEGGDYGKVNAIQGSYEDNYHTVLKAITGKPFTPYVQAEFYEIPIREVQCNGEGNELYIRNDSEPVCLRPHTYENLLQRGHTMERVQ